MRALSILCVLLLPTLAVAAGNPPHLKAGEWQYVKLGEGILSPGEVGTACLVDQSVLAKFDTLPDCTRRESHTDGAMTIANAQCRLPYNALSVREQIMKLNANDFYFYFHATYSPPVLQGTELEQSQAMIFAHLKWLGACRKGQTPSRFFF